jgi:hypothetical protein
MVSDAGAAGVSVLDRAFVAGAVTESCDATRCGCAEATNKGQSSSFGYALELETVEFGT